MGVDVYAADGSATDQTLPGPLVLKQFRDPTFDF